MDRNSERQQIIDAFSKVGQVIGTCFAYALQFADRHLAAPRAKHPELEFDFFQEYNREQAAQFLDCGVTKLDEACKSQQLGWHKSGREKLFTRGELERFRKLTQIRIE